MPQFRIMDASRNRWTAPGAVLAASSVVSGLPVSNSQTYERTAVWRSAVTTGTHTLDLDAGALVSTSGIAVANLRLVPGGVLEVYHRGDGVSPGAAVLLGTITGQDRDSRAAAAFWSTQSRRHYRLTFTNPGAVSAFVEVGLVHLGAFLELVNNPIVPAAPKRVDPSVLSVSVDGQRTTARRTKYHVGRWQWRNVTETQLAEHRAIFDALGASVPFFAVLDTAVGWTCQLVYLAGELEIGLETLAGRYAPAWAWEEAR